MRRSLLPLLRMSVPAFAALAAALAASSACSSVSAVGLDSDNVGVVEDASASLPACSDCVERACTAAWALCLTEPGCLAERQRVSREGCTAASGESNLYRTYTDCNAAAPCARSCTHTEPTLPGTCDAGGGALDAGADSFADGGSDASAPESCASCAGTFCGAALNMCGPGSECAAWLRCQNACQDDACVADCDSRHATGKAAAQQVAFCASKSCVTACGL